MTITSNGTARDLYTGGKYAALNPTWHTADSLWKAKHILRAIKQSGIDHNTVAEIGCGPGSILNELRARFEAEYSGFDPSLDAISMAQPHDHVSIKLGGIECMEEYDLVLCIDVIEHVEDVFGFLRSLLPKGKKFIFHIPLDMSCCGILRNTVMASREAVGHIHYFDRNTALATLKDCGFEVTNCFYTDSTEIHRQPFKGFLKHALFNMKPGLAALIFSGFSIMVTATSANA